MATKPEKKTKTTKPKLTAIENPIEPAPQAENTVKTPEFAVVESGKDDHTAPATTGDAVKLKEVLAAVVTKTGAKKKDAKDITDAVLAEIAAALAAGKSLSLPPLGQLRVARMQDKGAAKVLMVKIRQGSGGKAGEDAKDALEEYEEDS